MSNGIGRSVRERLLNISKTYGEKNGFMKLLVRYLHERLIILFFSIPLRLLASRLIRWKP